MPYGDRRVQAVLMPNRTDIYYGFSTDVSEVTSTALGHVTPDETTLKATLFGVNSPKPGRAKKFFGTANKGYEESFIATANITAARADGWEIKPRKISTLRNTRFARLVSVEARTNPGVVTRYFFTWRMPLWQYVAIGQNDLEALGIDIFDAGADDLINLVVGVTQKIARPKRVKKETITDGRKRIIQTFVAYDKEDNLPTGWA